MLVGLIAWAACQAAEVPAPIPLSLGVAALALLPSLGIIVGSLPILLLTWGLGSTAWGWRLTLLFLVLQLTSTVVVQPRIVKHSGLYVGPAIVCIAGLVGFELYGIGGGLYAIALVVLAVAAIDSWDEELPSVDVKNAGSDG